MDLQNVKDLLPRVIRQIVEDLGVVVALQLVKAFGGATIVVPVFRDARGERRYRMLADVVGSEQASRMVELYGGQELYIALCDEALRELRNREIRAEFDRLTQAEKLPAMQAVARLAPRYRKSDRTIWYVLNQIDRAASTEQATLF